MPLTRVLQLPPCLRYQREAPGQRLDQTPERGVGHQDHLLPVVLLEEGVQDWAGGLRGQTLLKHAQLEDNWRSVTQSRRRPVSPRRRSSDGWTCCSGRTRPDCRTVHIWNKKYFSILVIQVKKKKINKTKNHFNSMQLSFPPLNMFSVHNNNKPGLIYCQSWQTRVSVRVCDAGWSLQRRNTPCTFFPETHSRAHSRCR